jgi:hypothetical protein
MNAPTLVTLVTFSLGLAMGSGCRTWRALPPSAELPRPLASQSRVTRIDGLRFEIAGGLITADSVVGLSRATGRVSVPRDSVARVEERRLSWFRSIALGLSVWLAAAFFISGPDAVPG